MAAAPIHFIYVLRPAPLLCDASNWTDREEEIVERHFARLQELLVKGKLLLAGKTSGLDEKTFGIVILEVGSPEEAATIMNADPAVSEEIMTAELYPYSIALLREK